MMPSCTQVDEPAGVTWHTSVSRSYAAATQAKAGLLPPWSRVSTTPFDIPAPVWNAVVSARARLRNGAPAALDALPPTLKTATAFVFASEISHETS